MRDFVKAVSWICLAAALLRALPVAAAQEPPPAAGQAAQGQDEVAEEAGQKRRVEAIREFSTERRDEATAAARRAAEDLDRQIERLQQQMDVGWDRMSQATREQSQAAMADLRQRRNTLAEWFGGMRHSSGAAWGEVRGGFVNSYHELAEAVRKARAEFARQAQEDPAREAPQPDQTP